MELFSIINPIWKTLSEKLFMYFFEKFRARLSGTILTLEKSSGDNLIELTVSGNSEQEGTPTVNAPIPIKNVGSLIGEGEHVGKYAIPIKTSGKNLFNCVANRVPYGSLQIEDGTFTATVLIQHSSQRMQLSVPLENVQIGETYIFSFNADFQPVRCCAGESTSATDTSTISIFGQNFFQTELSFTVTQKTKTYLLLSVYTGDDVEVGTTYSISNVQLELGSTKTYYEPYHEPVTTTLFLDEPLRKDDTLEVISGVLVKRRANIASYNGEDVGAEWMSTTGELSIGATIEYELATPVEIDLFGKTVPTFEGTTIITIDTETAPEELSTTYWKSDADV